MSSPSGNRIILEVIEKGLDSLGESPKQAIWAFLENDYKLDKNKLPDNVRDFQAGLQKIFGLGYNFLDTLFCNYLEQVTGMHCKENQSFVEFVESQFCAQTKP